MNQNIKAAAKERYPLIKDILEDHIAKYKRMAFLSGATYFQQSSGADEMAEVAQELLMNLEREDEPMIIVKLHAALAKYNSFIKKEEDGMQSRGFNEQGKATIYPVEQEPEESQEELWNKIVSSVAAANIMGSVKKPSDINGIRNWKTYIISKLTKDYTITRKTTPQ